MAKRKRLSLLSAPAAGAVQTPTPAEAPALYPLGVVRGAAPIARVAEESAAMAALLNGNAPTRIILIPPPVCMVSPASRPTV